MSKKPAKPDIWMPLYIADWNDKTRHLTCEQDGAYGRLVRHYWINGPIPDDDTALACIVGLDRSKWRKLRGSLSTFFQIRDGRWFHDRVEEELRRAADLVSNKSKAGKAAAEARWSSDRGNRRITDASLTQCQTDAPAGVVVSNGSEALRPIQEEANPDSYLSEGTSGAEIIHLDGRGGR